MTRLAGILLAFTFALPACSAENNSNPTAAPVAETPTPATSTQSQAPPSEIVVAQADPDTARTPVAAPAARADIVEGRHYRVLNPAQPTSSAPDKIEVAEVFMYSCPHCYSFEPFITSYLESRPPYVSFVRIPASFNDMARLHSKAYYVAETLGVLDDIHMKFFKAFHTDRNLLKTEKALSDFFEANGVSKSDFENAFKSFSVDTKLRQADALAVRYKIDSVPTIVINGKYVTSGSMAGSVDKLREIVNYLVSKEASQT